jgi:SAM-dependent methyltransferase
MSNRYVGQLDVSLASFKEQIQTLMAIRDGKHPANTFWEVESRLWPSWWQKSYYEKPSEELLKMVPGNAKRILSIGCGCGATEARLSARGAAVTAIPLDSVIGAVAARRGIEVIYHAWDDCLKTLDGRRFDCVLLTNLLHLRPDPGCFVEQCARFVDEGGVLLLEGPNFDRIPWYFKRRYGTGEFRKLRDFDQSGISVCGPRTLETFTRKSGLEVTSVQWLNHEFGRGILRGRQIPLGSITARDWILQARRQPSHHLCKAESRASLCYSD